MHFCTAVVFICKSAVSESVCLRSFFSFYPFIMYHCAAASLASSLSRSRWELPLDVNIPLLPEPDHCVPCCSNTNSLQLFVKRFCQRPSADSPSESSASLCWSVNMESDGGLYIILRKGLVRLGLVLCCQSIKTASLKSCHYGTFGGDSVGSEILSVHNIFMENQDTKAPVGWS